MKLPSPTRERLLGLFRVFVADNNIEVLTRLNMSRLEYGLQSALDHAGIHATLDEFRLLVLSLHRIFNSHVQGLLSAAAAAEPFEGLEIEREIELLEELVANKSAENIAQRKNIPAIFAEVATKGLYKDIGMTPDEFAHMILVAVRRWEQDAIARVHETAEHFKTSVEKLF